MLDLLECLEHWRLLWWRTYIRSIQRLIKYASKYFRAQHMPFKEVNPAVKCFSIKCKRCLVTAQSILCIVESWACHHRRTSSCEMEDTKGYINIGCFLCILVFAKKGGRLTHHIRLNQVTAIAAAANSSGPRWPVNPQQLTDIHCYGWLQYCNEVEFATLRLDSLNSNLFSLAIQMTCNVQDTGIIFCQSCQSDFVLLKYQELIYTSRFVEPGDMCQ